MRCIRGLLVGGLLLTLVLPFGCRRNEDQKNLYVETPGQDVKVKLDDERKTDGDAEYKVKVDTPNEDREYKVKIDRDGD